MARAAQKNTRCPFKDECEKKCEYVYKELECSYYKNNANDDNFIPDQEEIRKAKELTKTREKEALLIANIDLDDIDDEILEPMVTTRVNGELSDVAVVRNIGLGYIIPSQDNFFNVESDITELAEDIKLNGLLSPLTICPSGEEGFFRLISGHRRYKALCSIHDNSFEVPCLVVAPRSKEAEEYMLIRSNLAVRELTWNEKEEARKRIEDLLLKMKAQGVEFPGKLRTYVAQLLKTSEAQLAKSKYVGEHLIKELQDIPDNRISFDNRYTISHWPEDIQKDFYDSKIKNGGSIWNAAYYNKEIKEGKNPFKIKSESSELKVRGCRYDSGPCVNVEIMNDLEDIPLNVNGCVFNCNNSNCCRYCVNRYICRYTCKKTKEVIEKERLQIDIKKIPNLQIRHTLRYFLLQKGFDLVKLEDLRNVDNINLSSGSACLLKYIYDPSLSLFDFLWYLSLIEMTPDEFLKYTKEHCDFCADLLQNTTAKPFEIYLGEDGESK